MNKTPLVTARQIEIETAYKGTYLAYRHGNYQLLSKNMRHISSGLPCQSRTALSRCFFPSTLPLDNFHHCQRVHEFHRGHELRNTGSVLSELEDEHDLHGNIRLSIVKRAVRGRLSGLSPMFSLSISVPLDSGPGTAHLKRDGTRVIYDVDDFELGRG